MKIVSNFKDYYDVMQRFGMDQALVYRRFSAGFNAIKPEEREALKQAQPQLSRLLEDYQRYRGQRFYGRYSYGGEDVILAVTHGILLFCGQAYPFIEAHIHQGEGVKLRKTLYQHEDSEAILLRDVPGLKPGLKNHYMVTHTLSRFLNFERTMKTSHRRFMPYVPLPIDTIASKAEAYCLEADAPLVVIRFNDTAPTVEINPCLLDMEFAKVKGADQVYQDIAQFVGNQLVKEIDPRSSLTDADVQQAKGFGHDYAFRTRPKG